MPQCLIGLVNDATVFQRLFVTSQYSSRRQGLRSSSSAKYVAQRTETKSAERAFSVVGPSMWNSLGLPVELRLESDTVLKRKLKPVPFCFYPVDLILSGFNVTIVVRYCTFSVT